MTLGIVSPPTIVTAASAVPSSEPSTMPMTVSSKLIPSPTSTVGWNR